LYFVIALTAIFAWIGPRFGRNPPEPEKPAQAVEAKSIPSAPKAEPGPAVEANSLASGPRVVEGAELVNIGDKAKFRGYTIVKVDPRETESNPEIASLKEDWAEAAANFLSARLGLSPQEIEQYAKAREETFSQYKQKTTPLYAELKSKYGPDVDLILEGDLQAEYDRAWNRYDEEIQKILGERGAEEFREYVKRFGDHAYDRVGLVPDFIR
jgi:hypothetical protein